MSLCNFSIARAALNRSLLGALLLASPFGIAVAQSLNIDIQGQFGTPVLPPNTDGGDAHQYGVWNDWRPQTFAQPMSAVDGAPTHVLMSVSVSLPAGVGNLQSFTSIPMGNPLREDFFETAAYDPTLSMTFTLTGLSLGTYDVFTYAGGWNCGFTNTVSIPTPGSSDPPQNVQFTARHRVIVTAGTIQVRISNGPACAQGNMIDCQGLQLVKLGDATTICAGDGTGSACPCANAGGAGRGCATSFEPLGALLSGTGASTVSSDSFVLSAAGVSDAGATFFQGSDAFGGGAGMAFADGLLCSGGTIVRLVTRFASGAQVSYPLVGDTPIGTLGGPQTVGSQRIYQLWYRDSAPGFCTSATFNLTNGVRTVWAP